MMIIMIILKINDINQRLNRLETLIDSKANKDLINSVCVNSENKTIFVSNILFRSLFYSFFY